MPVRFRESANSQRSDFAAVLSCAVAILAVFGIVAYNHIHARPRLEPVVYIPLVPQGSAQAQPSGAPQANPDFTHTAWRTTVLQ
jgi:hypothetical protein